MLPKLPVAATEQTAYQSDTDHSPDVHEVLLPKMGTLEINLARIFAEAADALDTLYIYFSLAGVKMKTQAVG